MTKFIVTSFIFISSSYYSLFSIKQRKPNQWGGDRGAGARENRGQEGYGRQEREGREAGKKCETLIFLIQQCITKLLKSRTRNIFDLHLRIIV